MRAVGFNAYAVKSGKGKDGDAKVESSIETGARPWTRIHFLFLYFICLSLSTPNSIMRSVLEEKTTRIVEVIVSSIKPYQLLLGKLVGVFAPSV